MNSKINIACLPVAGIENPYQHLMMQGLNVSKNLNAFNGVDDRFFGIYKTVKKYQPDYLHFDWIQNYYVRRRLWMTLILLPVFIFQIKFIKYFTKTKIVWTLHNILPHDAKYLNFHKWVRYFFAQNCIWVRVFSESSIHKASKVLGIPKSNFIIIPEGDYISWYENNVSKEIGRKTLKIRHESKVLMYLGFIKPYKGIEKLIEVFHELKEDNLELIIAGKGVNKEYTKRLKYNLKTLKDSRIKLIEAYISESELQLYYNSSDIVVLPFEKIENSGSSIMAMGFKKPIVAPNIGVLSKRLKQQDVLLYTNLKDGLNVALNLDKVELKTLGELNFTALKKYTWTDFSLAFV